jgi:hypothetical protein
MDRQTDKRDFRGYCHAVSFPVPKPVECRFIRLTQTGKNYSADSVLALSAVEFFGTLSG